VSSPTTKIPLAILNLDNNYSSSNEVYIEPAKSITTDHSAKWHQKTLEKLIHNLTDLSELPTFNPLQPIIPSHNTWNQLPILFSKLDDNTRIQIFNLFCTNSIINDSTSPNDPGLQYGSVQSGLMGMSHCTDPQTGSLELDGLGLDRSIYAYNFDIAF
jgi:hypothetical protein